MENKERQSQIHNKGFDMYSSSNITDYNKIKVGVKNLDDAILNLGAYQNLTPLPYKINKRAIFKAIAERDYAEQRKISNYFYDVSGIYQRACDYFSYLYRYDWYIASEIYSDTVKEEKVVKECYKILDFLDKSYLKYLFGNIASKVIKNGCYYGYITSLNNSLVLQELPVDYCRSRYSVGLSPAVEFNMKYFDTFSDITYRQKVLKLFPDEFRKGYVLYKSGKLPAENFDSISGWYLLDPKRTVKFNFNGSDTPIFVKAIPDIMDLDSAQDLDRRKQMQKLLKILIQKLPMDKNGDLLFDIDEAKDIHNNAVQMLSRAIGVDVLTTFTDVQSIDLSDKNTTTTRDDLEKVERTVFNGLGISKNLFNTDGNLSLEKSILNDESTVRNLILQFNVFMDRIIGFKNQNYKKFNFKFYFLETTQYNYQSLSKIYKEQAQIGNSKMLSQIALGHSQSSILNMAHFENEVLHLSEIMIPPLMSSTLSGEDILGKSSSSSSGENQNTTGSSDNLGRPEKEESQKSEKTLQNQESMS